MIPHTPAPCAGARRFVGLPLWGLSVSHAHVGHVGGSI